MLLSCVAPAGLTPWSASGLTGILGLAPGCGSSDTVITPLPEAGRHDVYHRQERFPPGFALHGDHLSVAVRIVLALVRPCQGSPLMAGRLGRVVMAVTQRADAGPTLCLRAAGERIPHT